MNYNVADRRIWARTKVDIMPPKDRAVLMEELMRRDEDTANAIAVAIRTEQAGARRKPRPRVIYPR